MKYFLILFLIGTTVICLKAQKLNKVTIEDLQSSAHPLDSTASAAYLYSSVRNEYLTRGSNRKLQLKYIYRIKIYNSEGESYSEFRIPLYKNGADKQKIKDLDAVTYNLENGEITETKLEKKNIYEEESTDYVEYLVFALPNVRPGSIIEVRYTKWSPFISTIPKWNFQNWIPTDYSKFEILVPNRFSFTPIATGLIPLNLVEDKVYTSDSSVKVTYDVSNVPALKEDKYVLNENDYRTSLKYDIQSYTYIDGREELFSKDWKSIGQNLWESEYFGKATRRKLKDLNAIIDHARSLGNDLQKVQYLYDYVRENFQWNKTYTKYIDQGVKDAINSGSGNIAEINLMLCNLLIRADIEAYPMVTKYRFDGLLNPYSPSISELDYVFVSAIVNGNEIYMDASSKYLPMGTLPVRAYNLHALKVIDEASQLVDMRNKNMYQSVQLNNITFDEEEDCIRVESSCRLSKFAASKFRIELSESEEDEDEQDIERSNVAEEDEEEDDDAILREDLFEIDSIENLEDIYKPIKYAGHAVKYSTHKRIGDQIFINAVFDYGLEENPFTEEDRQYPVFYNQLSSIRRIINFKIPEGYTLEQVPEPLAISTHNKKINFIYDPKMVDDKLNITFYLNVNSDIILPEEYQDFSTIYDRIMEKQGEQIILRKK